MRIWYTIPFVLCIMTAKMSWACDLCNNFEDIELEYDQNSMGVLYRNSSYEGIHSHDHGQLDHAQGTHESHLGNTMNEQYQTWVLWGRWHFSDKINLFGKIQASNYCETMNGSLTNQIIGLGDLTLVVNYSLLKNYDPDKTGLGHFLSIGSGIIIPTGAYQKKGSIGVVDPLLQPGTGSFGFHINSRYGVRKDKMGMTTIFNYQVNTPNSNGYLFANRLNVTALLFFRRAIQSLVLVPNGGLYYENAGMDLNTNQYQANTGGNVLFSQVGMDFYMNPLSLGIVAQIPTLENLHGIQGNNRCRLVVKCNVYLD